MPRNWFAFLAFWAVNMFVIWMGIDSIRVLLNIKAPLLIVLGLALLAWAYNAANGFGPMLAQPSQFDPGQPKAGQFWTFFFPALTGMIGFWATLSLNIPDFSRYARTQRDQMLGQALGLPPTMALYSFIGVAVTSATVTIYGQAIWDPVVVLSQVPRSDGAVDRHVVALSGDPGDQHRRQCRRTGQRLLSSLAAPDFVPNRRTHHRRAGNLDPAVEADRRPDGLYLPVAGGLFVASGSGRRYFDCRLLLTSPHPARPGGPLRQ